MEKKIKRLVSQLLEQLEPIHCQYLLEPKNSVDIFTFLTRLECPKMTILFRNYDIISPFGLLRIKPSKERFIEHAIRMNAYLGEEEMLYILQNQKDIPIEYRDRVFVFMNWRYPHDSNVVACLLWSKGEWTMGKVYLDKYDHDNYCVLRRRY